MFLTASGNLRRYFAHIDTACIGCNLIDCSLVLFYPNSSWPLFFDLLTEDMSLIPFSPLFSPGMCTCLPEIVQFPQAEFLDGRSYQQNTSLGL